MPAKTKYVEGMTPHRIEALADGIFAFSMTLLALSIHVPGLGEHFEGNLRAALLAQSDKLFTYALSFILLAVFWTMHHMLFHHVKKVDRSFLWLNVFLLMFISLVPLTTVLTSEFSRDIVSDILFAINLFTIGAIFYFAWDYVGKNEHISEGSLEKAELEKAKQRVLVLPATAILSVLFAIFVSHSYAPAVYLVTPFLLRLKLFGSD